MLIGPNGRDSPVFFGGPKNVGDLHNLRLVAFTAASPIIRPGTEVLVVYRDRSWQFGLPIAAKLSGMRQGQTAPLSQGPFGL